MSAPHIVSAPTYVAGALLATLLASPSGAADLQRQSSLAVTDGRLSNEMLQIIERLKNAPTVDERGENEPPRPDAPDEFAAEVGLVKMIDTITRALTTGIPGEAPYQPLGDAHAQLKLALSKYRRGSDDVSLTYLTVVIEHMKNAQSSLNAARLQTSRATDSALPDLQRHLTLVAQRMAKDVLDAARRAKVLPTRLAPAETSFARGLTALSKGDYVFATVGFGDSLGYAANTIQFDVALFESNIINAMSGEAIGYSLSITYNGLTYNGGHAEGLARTAANAPMQVQSPKKDMHVASVSKTLTTIVTLRLLQDLGLTPEAKVAPYLPSNWVLGDGVEDLTFSDFMTHRTGFGQQNVSGSSYSSLQTLIAQDVGTQAFDYDNDNFGLLRIAAAGLMGIDPVDYPEFSADTLTASAFLLQAQFLYGSIGVTVDCKATDPNPTIQYRFPDTGAAGYNEPDRSLACGGFGWFINANELAGVMAALRNTELLLSKEMREQMQDGFLGFMNPSNGYSSPNGDFGVYYAHGGDWYHGSGQLHSCAMAFPIVVQAALLINSERGAIPYQCNVLRDAFDNAWMP